MSFPFCWLFVRCLSRAIKFCGGKKARIQVFRNDGEGTYDLFYPKTQHTRQGRGCSVFCLVLVEKNVVCFSQAVPKELHSPKGVSAALISLGLQYNGSGPI